MFLQKDFDTQRIPGLQPLADVLRCDQAATKSTKNHKNVRKAVVLTRPYLVYYVYEDQFVEVIAVMHQRRNPKDWQVRVK
ncbi:MAG TPA: hypothetical protein VFJ16_30465 [Longimicrobium sp.]|nr:hypothetical protein [Longimicrobium sp.]